MAKTELYNKGIPVLIDLNKLVDYIGVPNIGEVIDHSLISEILGYSKNINKHRYDHIIKKWKDKLERENNILLRTLVNRGFQVCDASNRIDCASDKYKQGVRRIMRAGEIASRTNRNELNEEQKKVSDFLMITANRYLMAMSEDDNKKQMNESNLVGWKK